MPGVRLFGLVRALAIACMLAYAVAACASPPPPTPPPPTPTPTPAPTATPLAGLPLATAYRPEGAWTVSFSRPGDIVRETYDVTLTCPDGACDAIVAIADGSGTRIGEGTFLFHDDRYVFDSTTNQTVDCVAAGRTVRQGAVERVHTALVLARYRIAGTAVEQEAIQGTRTVTLEPRPGSTCEPSTVVYPAVGEPARR